MDSLACSFHATFSAHWRYYVYLLPKRIEGFAEEGEGGELKPNQMSEGCPSDARLRAGHLRALLKPLQGRELSFSAFARDTPKGKPCDCTLHFGDVTEATIAAAEEGAAPVDVFCIHLVCDRFLRRMVRVLVSTLVKEAVDLSNDGAGEGAGGAEGGSASAAGNGTGNGGERLMELALAGDRDQTQVPAPPQGLCLVHAGYAPWDEGGDHLRGHGLHQARGRKALSG